MARIPQCYRILTMAAEKGAAPAEYALVKLFYQGEAVPKDVGKALYHLESAAEKDHPYAAYLAGKIRLSEEGYLDVEKAVRLFEAAAALATTSRNTSWESSTFTVKMCPRIWRQPSAG